MVVLVWLCEYTLTTAECRKQDPQTVAGGTGGAGGDGGRGRGYNYQSGEWYKQTYRVFNKNYELEKKAKKEEKKEKLLDKIKSFF